MIWQGGKVVDWQVECGGIICAILKGGSAS